jgi:hypothetical protein
MLDGMTAMTTIKISTELRDRLAAVAADDYDSSTLADTLQRLLDEHEEQRVLAAYDRLRGDPDEWASYLAEQDEWDAVADDTRSADL